MELEDFAKQCECEIENIIDLSSSINFLKPKIFFDFNSIDISSYIKPTKLYESLGKNYNISTNQIELYNGFESAIFTLYRFLDLEYCNIYSPSYDFYKKAAINFSYKIRLINRFENMYLPIKDGSLVIFANPSYLDGQYYDLEKLLLYWISKNCTILIDESSLDFFNDKSAINYIKEYDKLYILKSMENFYASSGIRIAAIISNEENINKLKDIQAPRKISNFDNLYLQECLRDKNFKTISRAIIIKNRLELEEILKNSSLIDFFYKSRTNVILVKLKNLTAKEFQNRLKPYKIFVKDCSYFDYLGDDFISISVKSIKINRIFQKTLNKIC